MAPCLVLASLVTVVPATVVGRTCSAGARAPCFVTLPLMMLCQPEAHTGPATQGVQEARTCPVLLGGLIPKEHVATLDARRI